ncbi:MAG: ornithine cyclodeaminase family protein [Pseudomonadota bacterium]
MKVVELNAIRQAYDPAEATERIRAGFVAYSAGKVTVPPVGQLDFPEADGECHIKYGWIAGDSVFLVKIASGFYNNPRLGLPTSNGLMLLFSAETGAAEALLLDEGFLTDERTAIAGAISAACLAPRSVERIGIVGGGIQARLQLKHLAAVTDCREAMVWTRRPEAFAAYQAAMADHPFTLTGAASLQGLCNACNLIVTTTPATSALLEADWIRPGTHITCVGSDGVGKQELDPAIIAGADLCVVDARSQCVKFGEAQYAVAAGQIRAEQLVELGTVIAGDHPGRQSEEQITIADLTGVAVQNIAIAKAVWERLRN